MVVEFRWLSYQTFVCNMRLNVIYSCINITLSERVKHVSDILPTIKGKDDLNDFFFICLF